MAPSLSLFMTLAAFAFFISGTAHAFGVTTPSRVGIGFRPSTSLGLFGDALKGAFSNDDKLGTQQNAGLKGGPKYNDKVTINGKSVKAIVGQKVSVVAAAARVKIPYNCKNGDCGTCMIKVNGRKAKACQMNIPSGSCNMETL
mmetsp:Transcript_13576/g.24608  ORF Transcript_13576/g.24608 Transcript_13576/m.24608 type:complete len:143 (-) Transcript_13576:223-651(-)|eukprot:CAMPEP_0198288978 /NCGR_PEP_ID=MMETSP1449-20131203/7323_1 /TAXON_ID=420275 /ORGANISM="Attheya septentrionalis, Strain CCMP2084" /LENGTH=142 /DNA_ID=CAMNT_0043987227 /DNA_START=206 /DNA_END=634 /DNA_ORIENTATION=-